MQFSQVPCLQNGYLSPTAEALASRLAKGDTVACIQMTGSTYLTMLGIPLENNMVPFGPGTAYNSAGIMFNMSALVDDDDKSLRVLHER